ncbi:NAD/NADP octopine/nopaline dehydrogenase, alpha-helical domain-containing protein [Toxoplasma gondii VEG]|uniref:NAD/NADP octopine/nopaline dehydrogenase, alpha-helical domain-containing protein n=2 Tax=Toxoplasma gondii TaxID=5811 RepID=V4ZJ48_TOXGV|nr:NAD/NADP octopine/nopaline dehydrogenase, alpha-helical domain-containing protein [Toxoplasma gondii VEG]KFG33409.1 NAD/NADP octopine/nopaline dehydrogenase, alpha-helical domain-containing protein [Toxoplasma gondii p89]CEL75997.1 TPA: opine dehydrogenase, putative [Toxoplasma gondii VEG]
MGAPSPVAAGVAARTKSPLLTVCVCGGGNSAHAVAAWLGQAHKNVRVNVLTRQPEKWQKEIRLETKICRWDHLGSITGRVNAVSSDPAEVVPEADLCLICAPANAHFPLLEKIRHHLKAGGIIGTAFGQGGFDWAMLKAFEAEDCRKNLGCYFALQNLPWLCRIIQYGSAVELIGPKDFLNATVVPGNMGQPVRLLISLLFDMPCRLLPNFMAITLSPSNQIIHPARYYSIFHKWDGKTPMKEDEIQWGLYNQFDEMSAEWLEKLSTELQAIKKALTARFPELDLSSVLPIKERVIKHYGADVKDTSTLQTVFATNRGYAGCRTPATKVEGGYVPAVNGRLFNEDIPFGLCVLKDIAEQMDVPTPSIDFMIEWHQKLMGKEFLKDGKLNPEMIHETSAPRAYGLKTPEEIVAPSLMAQNATLPFAHIDMLGRLLN